MTDYSELVEALRWCSVDEYVPCTGCPMNEETHGTGCFNIMHQRAAAAIEALQADMKTYGDTAFKEGYEMGFAAGEARAEKRMEPKREKEVWKDVIGYEGLYQVSNQARVRNNKGKILKQSVKVGKCVYYKYVKLYKDGQYRQGYIHRMMAECFLPNPNNLPIINHKDEDGTNNRLDNLEWCTVEYNSNYGNAKRNMSRGKRRRAKTEVQDDKA